MVNKLILTLCIVHQGDKVLLGYKKRGFGEGKWNGFGGKLKQGESIEEAAVREVEEEAGIRTADLTKYGVLEFSFLHNDEVLIGHVFKAEEFEGEPSESEEMKPRWFKIKDIPYEKMWSDDKFWLPLFLAGKKFKGKFKFDKDDQMVSHELMVLKSLD